MSYPPVPSDTGRRSAFVFATGEADHHVWHKYDLPIGTQRYVVYESDGRAWISPDGNANVEPRPLHPATTFEEECAFLARLAIAPSLRLVRVGAEVHYTHTLWLATVSAIQPDAAYSWRDESEAWAGLSEEGQTP